MVNCVIYYHFIIKKYNDNIKINGEHKIFQKQSCIKICVNY